MLSLEPTMSKAADGKGSGPMSGTVLPVKSWAPTTRAKSSGPPGGLAWSIRSWGFGDGIAVAGQTITVEDDRIAGKAGGNLAGVKAAPCGGGGPESVALHGLSHGRRCSGWTGALRPRWRGHLRRGRCGRSAGQGWCR